MMKSERYLAIAIIGLALVVSPVVAASASSKDPAAQLSIALDNDHASVKAGDKLTYKLVVQNLGAKRVKDLRVTQSMPSGLEFDSADSSGKADARQVTWSLNIKANSTVTVRTTMNVAKTSGTLLRLASVACASTKADAPPAVCATDSDQLPAGASAAAAQAKPGDAGGRTVPVPQLVGSGIVVLLGVLTVLLVRRLRRRRRAGIE